MIVAYLAAESLTSRLRGWIKYLLFVIAFCVLIWGTPKTLYPLSSEEISNMGGTFHEVFGLSKVAVFASMMAYLTAQYIDIRIFHWLKRLTGGKYLWIRNNFSTFTSQFLDTFVVLALLASLGGEEVGITWARVPALFVNGILFKWVFALFDTPLFYAAVWWARRTFPQQMAELDAHGTSPPTADQRP